MSRIPYSAKVFENKFYVDFSLIPVPTMCKVSTYGTPAIFTQHPPFNLTDHICNTTIQINGKPRTLSRQRQTKLVTRLSKAANNRIETVAVAGTVNDRIAGAWTAMMMARRLCLYNERIVWHSISSDYKDRPRLPPNLDLLILSNLCDPVPQVKIDKIRDICSKHTRTSLLFVLAGIDPIAFFNERLHLSLNDALLIHDARILNRKTTHV
jgi:hypothetical protein